MMLKPLARLLRDRLVAVSRAPDQMVGDLEAPYMLRWRLWKHNPLLNGYLHRILRDDIEPAMHDHPWPSASLVLSGAVRETYSVRKQTGRRLLPTGALVVRGPRFAHRLSPEPSADVEVWTLFVTGPKLREWGFHCPQGWTHWEVYTAVDNDGRRHRCG